MKVFISQKMGGKLSEEIEEARSRATKEIKAMYGEDTEIIDTFFKDSDRTPLELLGESIKLMSDADLVVFIYDWQEEYESYCLKNGLCICEESAEQFVHHKDEELDKAIENGEA